MEFLIVFNSEQSNKHHMIDSDKIKLLKTFRKSKNVILWKIIFYQFFESNTPELIENNPILWKNHDYRWKMSFSEILSYVSHFWPSSYAAQRIWLDEIWITAHSGGARLLKINMLELSAIP